MNAKLLSPTTLNPSVLLVYLEKRLQMTLRREVVWIFFLNSNAPARRPEMETWHVYIGFVGVVLFDLVVFFKSAGDATARHEREQDENF